MNDPGREILNSVPKAASRGSGCLTVFASVFLLAGLAAGGLVVVQFYEAVTARGWAPVDATVIAAGLSTSADSDGGTTYRATGRFRYEWNGATYESDRVSFSRGHDNIGRFQRDLYTRLDRHRRSGEPLTVWVDPDSPARAVAHRDPHWGGAGLLGIFAVAFGGVGVLLLAGGRYAKRVAAREAVRAVEHPNEPWRWRDQWQSNTLTSRGRSGAWVITGFAAFWSLLSAPLMVVIPDAVRNDGNHLALIGLLFPLIGVGLIAAAIVAWRRQRRFGDTTLTLATMPLSLGASTAATLDVRSPLPPGTELRVTVSNVRRRKTGSGKNRSTRESVLSQDEQRVALPGGTSASHSVPLTLRVPTEGKESDWHNGDDQILWRVGVAADIPGVDLAATFEIPVIGRAEAPAATAAVDRARDTALDWAATGVVHTVTANGHTFTFPAMRHKGLVLKLALMALAFGGIGSWLWHGGLSSLAAGVLLLLGAVLALAALHSATYRSQLNVGSGRLDFRRGWLWLGAARRLGAADVKALRRDSSLSINDRRYYDIVADLNGGGRLKLANSLAGNRETGALIDHLASLTGLSRDPGSA